MANTQLKKMGIIELIMEVSDDALLDVIKQETLQLIQAAGSRPNPFEAAKPIRENVSLVQLMQEQKYKPIGYKAFRGLAKEVNLDDPIDELLSDLTA